MSLVEYWEQSNMNFLISIDQLFNALAGGNPDVTISGHIGAKAIDCEKWKKLEKIVDFTFYRGHCCDAFCNDSDVDELDNFAMTAFFAITGCVLLFIPIRIIKCLQQNLFHKPR